MEYKDLTVQKEHPQAPAANTLRVWAGPESTLKCTNSNNITREIPLCYNMRKEIFVCQDVRMLAKCNLVFNIIGRVVYMNVSDITLHGPAECAAYVRSELGAIPEQLRPRDNVSQIVSISDSRNTMNGTCWTDRGGQFVIGAGSGNKIHNVPTLKISSFGIMWLL